MKKKSSLQRAKSDSLQIELFKLQDNTKTSIIQAIDSSYQKSLNASNEALAKYSLSITDSLRSVVKKINVPRSQLSLVPKDSLGAIYLTTFNSSNVFKFRFTSSNGTSYNVFLDCIIIDEHYKILHMEPLVLGFVTEKQLNSLYSTALPEFLFTYDKTLIYLTGVFSNDPDNKSLVNYNEAVWYNFKNKKYISIAQMNFDTFKENLKKNNPDKSLPF